MLVQCVVTRVSSLRDAKIREHVADYVHSESIRLVVGRCYQVFGVCFRAGVPWYLICEDINDEYPTPFCASFFELIDGALDSGWSLTLSPYSNVGDVSLLPDEWAKDDRYLERLVDGEPKAVSYFHSLKNAELG